MNKLGHGTPSSRSPSSQNQNQSQSQSQSQNQNRTRRQHQQQPVECGDPAHDRRLVGPQAHTSTPVLVREPSVLESLSRNLRTLSFLPITISGPPPTPRRRPLSFGGVVGGKVTTPSADELPRTPVPTSRDPNAERITWAAWDAIGDMRVLLIAYTCGLQIWDTSDLRAVRELLNLRSESLPDAGPVRGAAILPAPTDFADEFRDMRPLLGILSSTHLSIRSLFTHFVVKQISFPGASSIVAGPAFIVISTTHPHILHILASHSLLLLYTISLPSAPIYALSRRLLAYASTRLASHTSSLEPPSPTFVSRARDSLGASMRRVGGEVWSGVKAAAAGLGAAASAADTEHALPGIPHSPTGGFSRSAPAASNQWSHPSPMDARPDPQSGPNAAWVTIVDLMPLLVSTVGLSSMSPQRVACFSPDGGVKHLAFAVAGATPLLCVAPHDGQRVAVFQIRPGHAEDVTEMPWHWYDLCRGVTSARVEHIVWEKTARWVGVVTGRRTVHIFPTNPYGGKPDERSHLEAQVYNATELQPLLSTEVTPLVRLRPTTTPSPQDACPDVAPLLLTFLPVAASLALPSSLLPHGSRHKPPNAIPARRSRSAHSSPMSLSPVRPHIAQPYQDLLLFDPAIGELALRRITLDRVAPALDTGMNLTGLSVGLGRGETGELVGKETVIATWALRRGRDWAEVGISVPPSSTRAERSGTKAPQTTKGSPADYVAQAELSTYSRSPAVLPRPIYLSHQFSFYALGEDYHALLRRSQLDVPCTKIEVRRDVQVRAYPADAESGATPAPFVDGSTVDLQHDGGGATAMRGTFDEPIASAIRSELDYSGQSPPVLPMLPNGAVLSVLDTIPMHTKHVAAGVNEGFGRIRREIGGRVRSPILRPTMVRPTTVAMSPSTENSVHGVPLEFDEEDETAFDLEGGAMEPEQEGGVALRDDDASGSGASASASVSVSTPSSRSRADLGRGGVEMDDPSAAGEDALWGAWDDEARATVAEAETFDEISATGFMDEEQPVCVPIMAALSKQQQQGKGGGGRLDRH